MSHPNTTGDRGAGDTGLRAFLREWRRAPRQVGAIAPSGRALARLITAEIDPGTAPVLELGPGTGVFTRALLARGIAPERLALVEASPAFAAALRTEFPGVRVLEMDAADLPREPPFGAERAGAIVCGLPFRAMPEETVFRIIEAAFGTLAEDGRFYLFTYGLKCPVSPQMRARLGLTSRRTGMALRNLPPAFVYALWREGGAG